MKKNFVALMLLAGLCLPARAQITPAMLHDFIDGLRISNDVAAPNSALDISAGSAVDSTSAVFIQVPATSKLATCPWAAGVGGCGMAPGLTVAPDTWYSVFAINTAGAADVYFDAPSVVPTALPSGATAYRHLGWFRTDSNSNILGMLCIDDLCWWKTDYGTQTAHDYGVYNPCNTATIPTGDFHTPPCTAILTLAHIPPGAPVTAILNTMISNISIPQEAVFWVLTSPDAPYTTGIGATGSEPSAPDVVTHQVQIPTNSYAQVLSTVTSYPAGAGQSGTIFVLDSKGWIYHRTPPPPPPPPPAGSISVASVVATLGTGFGTYTSVSLTTTAAVAAGNLVTIGVAINSTNSVGVASITLGSNTFTRAKQQVISANSDIELWYAISSAAVPPGTTLTVNLTGSTGVSSWVGIVALQASGTPASPLDQMAGTGNSGTVSATATTPALSQSNELAVGCSFQVNAQTYLGAAGFVIGSSAVSVARGLWCDYQLTSAVAPVTYTPTWSVGADRNGAVVGTFR